MSPESQSPQLITSESIPKAEAPAEAPKAIPVEFIEVPEHIKVTHSPNTLGAAAVSQAVREPVILEPQPGREPIEVPMPADPSRVIGWNGQVRH